MLVIELLFHLNMNTEGVMRLTGHSEHSTIKACLGIDESGKRLEIRKFSMATLKQNLGVSAD